MKATESREMYLEVIYDIHLKGNKIRSVDIAEMLGYSKPSVYRGVRVLKDEGLIEMEPYSDIVLTAKGFEIARDIKMRHDLLTEFLMKSLSLDAGIAEQDACRIEHVISKDSMEAIKNYLHKNK